MKKTTKQHPHHHGHSHPHNDAHSHMPNDKKILAISFLLITGFMLVEFWGGWYFHSLALMADAGHMANDSFSLLLAWVALFLSAKKQRFFAQLNGFSLIVVACLILIEAIKRWHSPIIIQAMPMMFVASMGFLVNLLVAWLMLKGNHENLNIKSAYLHVLADLLGSVVAIVAGFFVWSLNWYWVDVVASVLLSAFVLKSGVEIIRQSFSD